MANIKSSNDTVDERLVKIGKAAANVSNTESYVPTQVVLPANDKNADYRKGHNSGYDVLQPAAFINAFK